VVRCTELYTALMLLCGGKHEDKIRLAFTAFDRNNDNSITPNEVFHFMTSYFRMLLRIRNQQLVDRSLGSMYHGTDAQAGNGGTHMLLRYHAGGSGSNHHRAMLQRVRSGSQQQDHF
jgi:hypothetical protein